VLLISIVTEGWFYSFSSTIASVLIFNFLFTAPRFTLRAYWGIAFASGPNYNKAWHLFDPSDLQNTIPYINEITAVIVNVSIIHFSIGELYLMNKASEDFFNKKICIFNKQGYLIRYKKNRTFEYNLFFA
jgi:hypothetical protein